MRPRAALSFGISPYTQTWAKNGANSCGVDFGTFAQAKKVTPSPVSLGRDEASDRNRLFPAEWADL
ncbi:MAG: hypothetical protein DMG24_02860 [Acidobacteria bacterium]|nr:MAG: hypothetical protein DMG24_02860 [Acidobacteriota bacterium]